MIRRLFLILSTAGFSGCFDFDAAYVRFCDGGHCGDAGTATGGGSATGGAGGSFGGGGGGGVTGGGGGGGPTGGGGGTLDAGCPGFLCPVLDWSSSQSSEPFAYFSVAPGLNAQSLSRFNVYASFQTANFVSHVEFRFVNGVANTIFRTNFPPGRDARDLAGVSLTDQWFNFGGDAQHLVGNASAVAYSGCRLPDAGLTSPSHHAALPVSADEAWLVGYPMSVCHWTSDGGFVQTAPVGGAFSAMYLTDAYRAPTGEVFVVGGDYSTGAGVCFISSETGVQYSAPRVTDNYYTDGCNSVDGVGRDVFALARDDSAGRGHILRLQPDGGFDSVYTAPFRLARLDALPSGEVWAVGASGTTALYFDGGAWAEVVLPLTESRFNVEWDNVAGTDEGLILTGYERQADGGYAAVVNTYRRFGK